MLLAALTAFFIAPGCLLDGISVVVLTTSIILPFVQVLKRTRAASASAASSSSR